MEKIIPRWYQQEAIDAGTKADNGIIVAPTGSGKSIIISGIADNSGNRTLVLQPSKEILESNAAKMYKLGRTDVGVYSASKNSQTIDNITFATIGSIINCLELFKEFKTVIIDECHLVNAKGGNYEKLTKALDIKKLIGLTATPYRQTRNSMGSTQRILTRTRPKIFKNIIYYINPSQLIKEGFLSSPTIHSFKVDDSSLTVNTTGGDYTDASVSRYISENGLIETAIETIQSTDHSSYLVFADSIADSESLCYKLNRLGITAETISAKTKPKERSRYLQEFESGSIQVIVNVGTLTTGYDFPALESIIDIRPILSVALHYQKLGRVVRPFEGVEKHFYDIAGNVSNLGNPMFYELHKGMTGLPEIYNYDGRVTSIYNNEKDRDRIMEVGAHKGKSYSEIPESYIRWACDNWKKTDNLHALYGELIARKLRA